MPFSEEIKILRSSKMVHHKWYQETYADAAALGMASTEHYLRYGAAMGRNPGKGFDTQFYLETYLDAARSELNPLIHYIQFGKQRGYKPKGTEAPHRAARAEIDVIRNKLLSLGFTERPLAELNEIMQSSDNPAARALAARELALWHMREKTEEGYRSALSYITTARQTAPDLDFRSRLSVAELLCHYFLGQSGEGRAAYDRAALAGEVTPDVTLAWVNFQQTPALRVAWINQVLKRYDIPPLGLLADESLPPYDRLTSAGSLPVVSDGPKVTVLIAAYEAASMLPTALRSLQEQTWQNLEIIVIDDCSPSPETCAVAERFAAADPRIRLIRMEQNGGAYVARNRGLDEATGEYVTLHDADDWSHPLKIETQVRFMEENPDVMGCTSEQARCQDALTFTGIRRHYGFIIMNTSAFLWRRLPVREKLGYWDTVRFSADTEFIRRLRVVFGEAAMVKLKTGPLSFQREAKSSVTGDPVKGLGLFNFGVRLEYECAQNYFHASTKDLKYSGKPDVRPFPVSPMMLPEQSNSTDTNHFDIIYCGDFREATSSVKNVAKEIIKMQAEGRRVGVVNVYQYENDLPYASGICSNIREVLNGESTRVIVYGDHVSCNEIIDLNGTYRSYPHRYLPEIEVRLGVHR